MTMRVIAKLPNSFQGEQITKNVSPNISQDDLSNKPKFQKLEDLSKVPNKVKAGVVLTTVAGVATSLAFIMKGNGLSLNPSKIFKMSPKNWGIFKTEYKYKEKEILKMAAGSIGGGLLGGILFDKKENKNAKCREAIIQTVGNILIPLGCVSAGMRLVKKVEPKLLKYIPTLKETSKTIVKVNSAIKALPSLLATSISLLTGVLLGNKVGNSINEKVFGVKDNRKIKSGDLAPHLDDLCLAASLVSEDNVIGGTVSKVVPIALMIGGFATGTVQEHPERLHPKHPVLPADKKNVSFSGEVIKINTLTDKTASLKKILLSVHPQNIELGYRTEVSEVNELGQIAKKFFNKTDGTLAKIKFYGEDGKLISLNEYGPNESVTKAVSYDNGEAMSITEYHQNGNPIKCSFIGGDKSVGDKSKSVYLYNHENGKLREESFFDKNGNLTRTSEYNDNEVLIKDINYSDGFKSVYEYDGTTGEFIGGYMEDSKGNTRII